MSTAVAPRWAVLTTGEATALAGASLFATVAAFKHVRSQIFHDEQDALGWLREGR
jgi:hypothetical protein